MLLYPTIVQKFQFGSIFENLFIITKESYGNYTLLNNILLCAIVIMKIYSFSFIKNCLF